MPDDDGKRGASTLTSVSIVCNGNSGNQVSIQSAVGTNPPDADALGMCDKLVVLLCLEKDCILAGIFPRAFSDIPRNCKGKASSADEDAIDGARESRGECEDCEGVGW